MKQARRRSDSERQRDTVCVCVCGERAIDNEKQKRVSYSVKESKGSRSVRDVKDQ